MRLLGAALFVFGLGMYARLDLWPELRNVTSTLASAGCFFGLLILLDALKREIVRELRGEKPPTD